MKFCNSLFEFEVELDSCFSSQLSMKGSSPPFFFFIAITSQDLGL